MIHRVFSDLATFKAVTFREGLNILVADKSPGATERQTRNRAGKTSLIEIIHFILGASARPTSLIRTPALEPATFGMTFDVGGQGVTIERSGKKPSRVAIVDGDVEAWPLRPSLDRRLGHSYLSNEDWCSVLGSIMFGLAASDRRERPRFSPTFRSLLPYFVRRQLDEGFASPVRHTSKQDGWNEQVSVLYLLGLDWTIAQKFEEVRQRERSLAALRAAAGEGAFGAVIGTAAELQAHVAISEDRVRRLREHLAAFRVVPQYEELEREATVITGQLQALSRDNLADREVASRLSESLETEQPPAFADLNTLYGEAGIILPGLVAKRFEEVVAFHESVVENRHRHLEAEIDAARRRIAAREAESAALDGRRATIMTTLHEGGALDQFIHLQEELGRLEGSAESLRQRYAAAVQLESGKTDLDIERAHLHKRLQDDLQAQRQTIAEAILAFERLSKALYGTPGILAVSSTANGPVVDPRIEGSRSKGIANMRIFCFDMMLMELWAARKAGPGFLVHDSHLFDGVDTRQVGRALRLGAERAAELGFQYIITMNSDALPYETVGEGFDLDSFILDVRLTDASVDGGLFGFRFD